MNPLPLAPDIQEEVLALGYPAGREPTPARTLRRRLESLIWEDLRALWAELRAVAGKVQAPTPAGQPTLTEPRRSSSRLSATRRA